VRGWRTACLALLVTLAFPALAEDRMAEVRAITTPVPPFVIAKDGQLTGFSIDLWDEVAARLHLKTSFRVVPDIVAIAGALRSNESDVAVSAVFYTVEVTRISRNATRAARAGAFPHRACGI
jgi:polar amino acid transport system substrate-binding protein